jgi:hypothetical protein
MRADFLSDLPLPALGDCRGMPLAERLIDGRGVKLGVVTEWAYELVLSH